MKKFSLRYIGIILGSGILFINNAYASSQTANMAVSATVTGTCAVSASAMNFGTFSGSAATTTSTVSVTCTNGLPYTVDLSAGGGAGATTTTRKLTSSGNTLTYSIYKDNGYATIWGTSSDTVSGTGDGSAQSLTAYGKMDANATPVVGSYTDTVVVTVNY